MATAQIKLARYLLIINRLMNRKQAFKELDMYLQNQSAIRGYDCTISIRNFQKEIHVIRELFGVDICNNRSDHTYYINEVNSFWNYDRFTKVRVPDVDPLIIEVNSLFSDTDY